MGMENVIERFGTNVRRARNERGWSQERLALETGLATVQISRIECGRREVRLRTLIRLLDALEARPEALLEGLVERGQPKQRR